MTASDAKAQTLGFLTCTESPELGICGGYLVLNTVGRPIEFHCTAPLKPNRAQEILYGPTLRPFLFGEQIAGTLVGKGKSQPICLVTDNEYIAAVRMQSEIPTALILAPGHELPNPALWLGFRLGDLRLAVWKRFAADEQQLCEQVSQHLDHLDLAEPFTRIREALEEAQKVARPAA